MYKKPTIINTFIYSQKKFSIRSDEDNLLKYIYV